MRSGLLREALAFRPQVRDDLVLLGQQLGQLLLAHPVFLQDLEKNYAVMNLVYARKKSLKQNLFVFFPKHVSCVTEMEVMTFLDPIEQALELWNSWN